LADGALRIVIVWHRRCGKDYTALNLLIKESLKRIGVYFYFFPTYALGRKTVWEGFDYSGKPFLDCLPPGTVKNETEMKNDLEKNFDDSSIHPRGFCIEWNRKRG